VGTSLIALLLIAFGAGPSLSLVCRSGCLTPAASQAVSHGCHESPVSDQGDRLVPDRSGCEHADSLSAAPADRAKVAGPVHVHGAYDLLNAPPSHGGPHFGTAPATPATGSTVQPPLRL
jgi:hypothetical protein